MKTVSPIHNTIIQGVYYSRGDAIEESIIPPHLRKYIAKPESKVRVNPAERNIMQEYNRRYSVSADDGFPMPTVGRQAAQMKAEAEQDDFVKDQMAEAKLSPSTEADLERTQKDYQDDMRQQVMNAEIAARNADTLNDSLRQEQDERTAAGDFDVLDSDSFREVSNNGEVKPKRKPEPLAQSSNLGKSYVRRGPNTFVGANTVKLVPGEPLFRHRKKSFGVAEKFIRYSKVK